MSDQVKIEIVANSEPLRQLIDAFNKGNITIAQTSELLKKLKSEKGTFTAADTEEVQKYNSAINRVNQSIKESAPRYAEMTAHIRVARQEKRMLMFMVNEVIGTFDGLSNAIGVFVGASEGGQKTIKGTMTALKESAGAAMGIKFAMDMAGKSFAAFSMPAALVIGAITLITGLFTAFTKEAKEANEKGLNTFVKGFDSLADKNKLQTIESLKASIKSLNNELGAMSETMLVPTASGRTRSVMVPKIGKTEEFQSAKQQISDKEKLLEKAEDEYKLQQEYIKGEKVAADALQGHYNTIQQVNRALAIRKEEITQGVDLSTRENLTQSQIKFRLDEINRLEYQKKEMSKSSLEAATEEAQLAKQEYNQGQLSAAQYIAKLQAQKEYTLDKVKQKAIEDEIYAIGIKEANLEAQREEKRKKFGQDQAAAESDLYEMSIAPGAGDKSREAELKREENRHTKALADIEYKKSQAGEGGEGYAATASETENADYERNVAKIKLNYDLKSLEARYKAGQISSASYSEGLREAALRAKTDEERLAIEEKIHALDTKNWQNLESGINGISQGLSNIGMKTDSFVSKLSSAVKYALELAKALSSEDSGSFGGIGQMFSSATGLLSLFGLSTGGYIPFAANGGTFGPGSNVLVGDDNGRINRTTELMQVGHGGVRILSNNNLRKANIASASSGNASNSAMLRTINNMQLTTVVKGQDLVVMLDQAGRARGGRTGSAS